MRYPLRFVIPAALLATSLFAAVALSVTSNSPVAASVAAIAILVLAGLWCLFLRNALLGRMSQLVAAMRNIGSGDLQTPICIEGQDEIAFLGHAMDTMRSQLADSTRKLRLSGEDLAAANAAVESERKSLEEKIAERTRDLTRANRELATARDSAEAASRAKSAFLATVSHEIRTPMNGIIGAMELLDRSGLDSGRAPLLKTAQESARLLLMLLNDLLDMAKIEAGRMEIVSAPASVESMLEQVVATHAPTAVARNLRLVSHIDPATPGWIEADALRVQQILGNFVSNAVKFTRDGIIDIRVTAAAKDARHHHLSFSVTDDGCGIHPEVLRKLFQPFEQGSVDASRRSEGTGLGLAICRGLADRMGGTVHLQSTPGKGTTASFELTVAAASAPRQRSHDAAGDNSAIMAVLDENAANDGGAIRALVVDDHPINRLLQVRQLEQLGVTADSAVDGIAALAKLRQEPFDIVITDCEMPGMDGFALARAIRESDAQFHSIPVVACTAHAMPEVAVRCRESGMNDVLTKPLRLNELAQILRQHWPSRMGSIADTGRAAMLRQLPVLDEAQVEILAGGDHGVRSQLVRNLLNDNRESLLLLGDYLDQGNMDACRALAHRNKGACSLFGAESLADAYAGLERAAGDTPPDTQQARQACHRVQLEIERLASRLNVAA